MTASRFQTKSEQKLEYLKSLKRPLSERESEELRRAMHAVYEHERRLSLIQMDRSEELELLERVKAESALPEWHSRERT